MAQTALQLLISVPQQVRVVATKACISAICGFALAVAGCAPGMNGPSLGTKPRASAPAESSAPVTEVVVVQQPKPEERLASQLRSQENEIAKLRDELSANRTRADSADAAARDAQTAVRDLQTQLADVNVRLNTAAAQSEKAFQISTEFLSNLVAAREEQRSLIERNLRTFDAMDQRLKSIETLVAESRKLRESDAAAAQANVSQTDQRLQKADRELAQLREQLNVVNRENQEVRAAIDSGAMMSMLRDLQATQRDTSMLRGAVEEMQREQEAARKRMQDYYLDLDARIQALQDKQSAVRKPGANGTGAGGESFSAPAAIGGEQSDSGSTRPVQGLEAVSPSGGGDRQPSMESKSLPPLEIVPFEAGTEGHYDDATDSTPTTSTDGERRELTGKQAGEMLPTNNVQPTTSNAREKVQPPPVTAHGLFTTDWNVSKSPSASGEPTR